MSTPNARTRLLRFFLCALGGSVGFFVSSWLTSRDNEWHQYWYLFLLCGSLAAVPSLVTDSFHARLEKPLSARGSWLAIGVTIGMSVLLFLGLLAVIR